MKKLVALLLAVLMVAALFVGCANTDKPAETDAPKTDAPATDAPATDAPATDEPAPEVDYSDWHVAMITDYGDITDESFNQATYEGCQTFCETNGVDFKYYKPTGDSTAERVAAVDQAIAEGYNVLVCPGFAFAGTMVEAAPNYPDVKFIALDVALGDLLEQAVGADYDYNPDNWNLADYVDLSNVYCAIYQEEIAGYLAGYAAVKLGYTKLGFCGGMAVPAVQRYGYGFVQGCNAAAEDPAAISVKYVYGNQFFGDPDITAYMDTWYADGTEIVFACGGGIYTSVAEAAAKVEGAKVIGVDVDQAPTIDAYGEGMTVTSAMKGLSATAIDTLTDIICNGNWDTYAGQISTLGLVSGDDPTLNYVQIPASTQWADGFTEDDYIALVAELFGNPGMVSADTTAEPAVEIAVDYQGNIK